MTGQAILTIVVVVLACSYLAYRGLRLVRGKKAGCGGACACPTSAAKQATDVVALGTRRVRRG